jgi:hypothetical protein
MSISLCFAAVVVRRQGIMSFVSLPLVLLSLVFPSLADGEDDEGDNDSEDDG